MEMIRALVTRQPLALTSLATHAILALFVPFGGNVTDL
jgi:hypothetical protein